MKAFEKKHERLVRMLAPGCTVLLRSNGDFPLTGRCEIALYGSGARQTVYGGTGSGEVNTRSHTNVEDALIGAGFTVTTSAWLDAYDRIRQEAHRAFIRQIKERAKKEHVMAPLIGMGAVMPEPEYELAKNGTGDVAVYVLGRISGEGNDRQAVRGDVLLTETEKRDILVLQQQYQKFLLVLNVGGPVDLSGLDAVENILLLSQLGAHTGNVLADLIAGKAYPSGKLATTWADWGEYCAEGTFGDKNETLNREGIYVGYRYFDRVGKMPRFPFGFGLSYTSFDWRAEEVQLEEDLVKVRALVRNTGNFWGREVLQLYVSVPGKKIPSAPQALAAFAKTGELKPGAECETELCFSLRDLASYDEAHTCYVLEEGDYVLRLGNSSRHTRVCGILRLTRDVVTRTVQAKCGDPKMTEWEPPVQDANETYEGVPVLVTDRFLTPTPIAVRRLRNSRASPAICRRPMASPQVPGRATTSRRLPIVSWPV